jgi:exodeoxyribonuclease VII large subunit
MEKNLQQKQQQVDWLSKRIRHPKERLQSLQNKLAQLSQRSLRSIESNVEKSHYKVNLLNSKIQRHSPLHRAQQLRLHYENIHKRFQLARSQAIVNKRQKLQHLIHTLEALSPLHTLKRGYAIIKDENNNIVSQCNKLKPGQKIKTELNQGYFFSTITDINNE